MSGFFGFRVPEEERGSGGKQNRNGENRRKQNWDAGRKAGTVSGSRSRNRRGKEKRQYIFRAAFHRTAGAYPDRFSFQPVKYRFTYIGKL